MYGQWVWNLNKDYQQWTLRQMARNQIQKILLKMKNDIPEEYWLWRYNCHDI